MFDTELTRQIIGAAIAIEVHRLLGPGLLESAYEDSSAANSRCATFASRSRSQFHLFIKGPN